MAGEGGRGPWPSQFPQNRRIFGNFHVLSENIGTFAVGKYEGFEFYRKLFELSPPP